MSIPRIGVHQIGTQKVQIADNYTNDIPNVYVPRWMTTQPNVDYLLPPVVVNIGNPIVDIPGCVRCPRMIGDRKIILQSIKRWLRMILKRQ